MPSLFKSPLFLIVFLGLLTYANTLDSPFHFDDNIYLRESINSPNSNNLFPSILDFEYLQDSELSRLIRPELQNHRYLKTRTTGYWSLLGNYWLNGLNPIGYHAVNVVIHLLNTVLLYLFVLLTLRSPFFKVNLHGIERIEHWIASLTTALFALHPVQSSSVSYIAQRFVLLANLFSLMCFVGYVYFRLSDDALRKREAFILSLVAAIFAMKSKEFTFTLPMALATYEILFFSEKTSKRLVMLLPYGLTMLLIPIAYMQEYISLSQDLSTALQSGSRLQSVLPRFEYLLIEFRALISYIRMMFLPFNQSIDHFFPVFPHPLSWPVITSAVALGTICTTGILFAVRFRERPELRLISFGIAWFFLTLAVTSTVFPLSELFVEDRLYAPSVGWALIMAGIVLWIIHTVPITRTRWIVNSLILIVALLAVMTVVRNSVWKSRVSLMRDAVNKAPLHVRPLYNLAIEYGKAGEDELKRKYLEEILAKEPNYIQAIISLAEYYIDAESYDRALELYQRALALSPLDAKLNNNLGTLYRRIGETEKSKIYHLNAIKAEPYFPEAYNNLGIVYRQTGMLREAVVNYEKAIELRPAFAEAYNNLGVAKLHMGDVELALQYFRKAITINPRFADALHNLATIYRDNIGDNELAAVYYRRALEINPELGKN